MVGACVAHYSVKGAARQWVLFSSVIPLLFVSEILRIVVILGLMSGGQDKLAMWFFHDWQAVFQFFFVVGVMFGIRKIMLKWWPVQVARL